MKHNTFNKGSKHRAINGGKDQYYTKQYVSLYLTSIVIEMYGADKKYIEPCAGHGSFLKALEENGVEDLYAFDIEPNDDNISNTNIDKQDWFNVGQNIIENSIVITNPPFGFMASLAIDFFNHTAKNNADVIAFLVPKSFKKTSIKNKLDLNYSLKREIEIPESSFILDGESYNVPCVFQIWNKTKKKRDIITEPKNELYEFVEPPQADIAIRRVGGKSGQVLDGIDHSKSSTYFIKIKSNKDIVKKAFKLMDINKYVNNTAGVKSISIDEINAEMNRILGILL